MFRIIRAAIYTSTKRLLTNKSRSFLTMLGIIIGVGAVIIIMSLGAGAQGLILDQIKSFGTDKIGILPGQSEDDGPPASVYGIVITTLTYDDAIAISKKNNVPNIDAVVAYSIGVENTTYKANSYSTTIKGVTHEYPEVEGGELVGGRFITEDEEKGLSRVAVLGHTVKEELFGATNPVGKKIKIKKHIFEVIGVIEERGTVAFQNYDDQILIPIKTMQKTILGVDYVNMIRTKVDDEANIHKAQEDIILTLRDQHDIDDQTGESDDFTVRNSADALDIISTITNSLKFFLAAMAALSLLVGGIGIMNIMLMSVKERTREIGLRKAVGANNSNIITQFLLETVAMTTIGGAFGVILGISISYIASLVIQQLGYSWTFSVSLSSIILSLMVASITGLVFGIYPASKASKLSPVEALRYE